jgi:hypothetical protein
MSPSPKTGGWFCPKKRADGSWCQQKAPATGGPTMPAPPPQAAPQVPQWAPPTPQAPAAQSSLLSDSGDAALAGAALRFGASIIAARPIEHDTADQAAAAGISIAITAYRTMKAYLP